MEQMCFSSTHKSVLRCANQSTAAWITGEHRILPSSVIFHCQSTTTFAGGCEVWIVDLWVTTIVKMAVCSRPSRPPRVPTSQNPNNEYLSTDRYGWSSLSFFFLLLSKERQSTDSKVEITITCNCSTDFHHIINVTGVKLSSQRNLCC